MLTYLGRSVQDENCKIAATQWRGYVLIVQNTTIIDTYECKNTAKNTYAIAFAPEGP
jgi:hypothetical protein